MFASCSVHFWMHHIVFQCALISRLKKSWTVKSVVSWNWKLEQKSLLCHIDCAHLVDRVYKTFTMGIVVDISATAHITRSNRYTLDKVHISHKQWIWRWRDWKWNAFIRWKVIEWFNSYSIGTRQTWSWKCVTQDSHHTIVNSKSFQTI